MAGSVCGGHRVTRTRRAFNTTGEGDVSRQGQGAAARKAVDGVRWGVRGAHRRGPAPAAQGGAQEGATGATTTPASAPFTPFFISCVQSEHPNTFINRSHRPPTNPFGLRLLRSILDHSRILLDGRRTRDRWRRCATTITTAPAPRMTRARRDSPRPALPKAETHDAYFTTSSPDVERESRAWSRRGEGRASLVSEARAPEDRTRTSFRIVPRGGAAVHMEWDLTSVARCMASCFVHYRTHYVR